MLNVDLPKSTSEFTELKSTTSSNKQALDIYGVPSVSYGYEDAKWQAVSRSTYLFSLNTVPSIS